MPFIDEGGSSVNDVHILDNGGFLQSEEYTATIPAGTNKWSDWQNFASIANEPIIIMGYDFWGQNTFTPHVIVQLAYNEGSLLIGEFYDRLIVGSIATIGYAKAEFAQPYIYIDPSNAPLLRFRGSCSAATLHQISFQFGIVSKIRKV